MYVTTGAQPVDAGRAWRHLGADSELRLVRSEVVSVELPFVRPVQTAVGVHRYRSLVLVKLVCRAADGTLVEGWGECAALADTTYDGEDADAAFATLVDDLLPALVAATGADRRLPPVGLLADIAERGNRPLAWAALEMAVGDAHLRSSGTSFADLLGVAGAQVEPGAVLGLPSSVTDLAADLERLRIAGFARVKIKVAPGVEGVIAAAVSAGSEGSLPVQVDANGAYGASTVDGLQTLDGLGLLCVEQPLGRDDLSGHRALAGTLTTPICLDESLDSLDRIVEAVTSGACGVVCVKPSRLGGIGVALDAIDWCRVNGTPWWVGGMFESGYARRALAVLAALPGPSLPGDLAPPATYLSGDLVEADPGTVDPSTGRLHLTLHDGPGLAPAPSASFVDSRCVRRSVVPCPS